VWRKRDWKSAAATNVIVYQSLSRRGGDTLHRAYGPGFAINVGNATNLLGLRRVIESRSRYGPTMAFAITEETECMMRQSLEGQAIELGWIRDKCLRAYAGRLFSFIYPIRVGAIIAPGSTLDPKRFSRFGRYFGAAFQIQDDLLNLTGEFAKYGKELGGDIAEGKRTLMLIHLLTACTAREACTDALSREALRKAVSSRNRRGLCANGRLRQHRIRATLGAPARRCHLARSRHRLPRRARFTSVAVHLPDGHVCGEPGSVSKQTPRMASS
jgi:geranylgeranyl pyrophosphate synthase